MESQVPSPAPKAGMMMGPEGGIPHFQKMLVAAFVQGCPPHPQGLGVGTGRTGGSAWNPPLCCRSLEGKL